MSKCDNKECTLKEKCHRFKAESNSPHQWYTTFKQEEDGTCNHFRRLRVKKRRIASSETFRK